VNQKPSEACFDQAMDFKVLISENPLIKKRFLPTKIATKTLYHY
jgi:hypothetical protein